MAVIARDAVAADQLVFAWPYPINGGVEVSCREDEVVVMCPAWAVGDRLGPGRHNWRNPEPSKPSGAYFVLTGPVEAPFEMTSAFVLPANGMTARLRASGSMLVRCSDPSLLIAQFVGLPLERVNDGLLHSVSQSVARLLGRVLARRVVMAGTPLAVTDPQMLPSIVEELIAYNPTGGAVFGVEFVRFNQLMIQSEDLNGMWDAHQQSHSSPGWGMPSDPNLNSGMQHVDPMTGQLMSQPGMGYVDPMAQSYPGMNAMPQHDPQAMSMAMPMPAGMHHDGSNGSSNAGVPIASAAPSVVVESQLAPPPPSAAPIAATGPAISSQTKTAVSGEIGSKSSGSPASQPAATIEPRSTTIPPPSADDPFADAPPPLPVGKRVLVAGPDGRLHSAVVRQHLAGYYEIEVGSSGEVVWMPGAQLMPE